jgi:hypothetical protein
MTVYSFSYKGNAEEELIGTVSSYTRKNNVLNAILSIIRTFFISFVLSAGAMTFSNDVELLVVSPIETMLE